MRFIVQGEIIEKNKPYKSNYTHEIYSMIMNNLHKDIVTEFHKKNREYRYLSFSNVHIRGNSAHFYLVAREDIAKSLIDHLAANMIIRLGDMVINIKKIIPQNSVQKRDKYLFKTSLIVNINRDGKCMLSDEIEYIESRLKEITISKASQCGLENKDITFEMINPIHKVNKYKGGHIDSWKCFLKVTGDYELIDFIYSISGVGENTATGHGLLWEVS